MRKKLEYPPLGYVYAKMPVHTTQRCKYRVLSYINLIFGTNGNNYVSSEL